MDVDTFWQLLDRSARETDGKKARLAWLEDRFAERAGDDIIAFDACILAAWGARRSSAWPATRTPSPIPPTRPGLDDKRESSSRLPRINRHMRDLERDH